VIVASVVGIVVGRGGMIVVIVIGVGFGQGVQAG